MHVRALAPMRFVNDFTHDNIEWENENKDAEKKNCENVCPLFEWRKKR